MFNKGNCPVPSQLPASHCSGKPFSNMRWMSLEATSRRRRILLARILFYWDFCELRSKKHFAENRLLNKVIIANLHELYNEIWKKNPPACLAEGNKTKVCLKNHSHKL